MNRKRVLLTRIKDDDPVRSLQILRELEEKRTDYVVDVDKGRIWIDIMSYIWTERVQKKVREVKGTSKCHNLTLTTGDPKDNIVLVINNYHPELKITRSEDIKVKCGFIKLELNEEMPIMMGMIEIEVTVPMINGRYAPSPVMIEEKRYEAYLYLLEFLPGINIDQIKWI